ncbi:hypothetical protein J132_07840 [Termitomyces sp. J132]|nr:hypothetical protein J132_07840 [Termitomyces sp. J132]
MLMQLHTGHIPLKQYLFRICHSKTPVCPHCGNLIVESIKHYLFVCPHYACKRHAFLHRKLGCKAELLSYILSIPNALKPLFDFVIALKQFQPDTTPRLLC